MILLPWVRRASEYSSHWSEEWTPEIYLSCWRCCTLRVMRTNVASVHSKSAIQGTHDMCGAWIVEAWQVFIVEEEIILRDSFFVCLLLLLSVRSCPSGSINTFFWEWDCKSKIRRMFFVSSTPDTHKSRWEERIPLEATRTRGRLSRTVPTIYFALQRTFWSFPLPHKVADWDSGERENTLRSACLKLRFVLSSICSLALDVSQRRLNFYRRHHRPRNSNEVLSLIAFWSDRMKHNVTSFALCTQINLSLDKNDTSASLIDFDESWAIVFS